MLHTLCSFSQALSHPPTNPLQPIPLSHQWLTALTLTKTPACGSMVYFLWMKGPNESAFLSQLWEEAAGCLVSSGQMLVFYIHVLHRGIWLSAEQRKEEEEENHRTRRTSTTKIKWGPGGWCAENRCGNAATPPQVAPPVNCRPEQRRNWIWCGGERSERRANICCDGLGFFISNKSHMSVSKPSHGQFLFLFSERGKRIKTCAVDPLVYIQKKSAS